MGSSRLCGFARLLTGGFLLSHALGAEEARTLQIPRVRRPPLLEDFLQGRPREAETVVTDFRQFEPKDGAPVSQPTTAYLSYDAQHLYVIFVCKDDPKQIRARLNRRDQLLQDDRVSISLDTFRDRARSTFFDVNPYGVQMDGVTASGQDDFTFDTLWYSEGRLTPDGYVALIKVPFKSLRFPATPTQTWGVVLNRLIMRSNEIVCAPSLSPSRPGWTAQFGDLEGIRDVAQGRNLQFIPYLLGSTGRDLDPALPALVTRRERRAGLDAKAVLADALTLDLTLRPDFSQVESDEPQVTVNQRFEVFFPEKRPFFLENASYFTTPVPLLFSRRIADPRVGARLTGKVAGWTLGMLAADDHAEEEASGASPASGQRAGVGVLRFFREFGKDERMGFMTTEHRLGDTRNRVVSLDSRLLLGEAWTLEAQALESRSQDASGRLETGTGLLAGLSRHGRNVGGGVRYERFADSFRTALGFVPRVGMQRLTQDSFYRWRPEGGSVLSHGPTLSLVQVWEPGGRETDWEIEPSYTLELPLQTKVVVEREIASEHYGNQRFRRHETQVEFSTEPLGWLGCSGSLKRGTAIAYDPAPGLAPWLGRSTEASFTLTLRPGARLLVAGSWIQSRLDRQDGTPGFTNHLGRLKVNVQATRAWSFRAILDWNDLRPNRRFLDLERQRRLGGDVLVAYVLNPGTAFYFGATRNRENLVLDPTLSPALRRTEGLNLATGTQVYTKVSWLFRM